jgi:MFS family permease
VWAEAPYRFHANQAQMSILLASFSGPLVLLVPFQGILVDRWSPKWLFVLGIVSAIAAIPPAWGASSIRWLYLSSFFMGSAIAAIAPARSALTGLFVEGRRLVQANGMLSASIQLALVVGPFTAGVVLRTAGAGSLYPGVLAVAMLSLALALLVPDRRQGGIRPALSLRDLGDGIATTWRISELRLLLWLSTAAWLMVNVYWALQSLYVKNSLHLGSDAVPFLWAAQGAGALLGSVLLYRQEHGAGRELVFTGIGLAGTGAGLMVFALSNAYVVAVAGMVVFGLGFAVYFSSSLALIQRLAGEEKRGRVTSVFTVIQEGTSVLAAGFIVVLGGLVVVRPSLAVSGGILVVAGGLGLLRLSGRPRGRPAQDTAR